MPSPKPEAPPAHALAGTYADSSGRCYVVPPGPLFALFRAGPDGQPLIPHNLILANANAFMRALGWQTFRKI